MKNSSLGNDLKWLSSVDALDALDARDALGTHWTHGTAPCTTHWTGKTTRTRAHRNGHGTVDGHTGGKGLGHGARHGGLVQDARARITRHSSPSLVFHSSASQNIKYKKNSSV